MWWSFEPASLLYLYIYFRFSQHNTVAFIEENPFFKYFVFLDPFLND